MTQIRPSANPDVLSFIVEQTLIDVECLLLHAFKHKGIGRLRGVVRQGLRFGRQLIGARY